MPETDPLDRKGARDAKVNELERVIKALLKAMQDIEDELGEPVMPAGDYYGIKFEQ
jgi:hypothetical protein